MTKLYSKDKCLQKVLNGEFPAEDVKKMNKKRLEVFVLRLVECSNSSSVQSSNGGKDITSISGLINGNRPKWWPRDDILEKNLYSKDNKSLRLLVFKCCEFFRKTYYPENWIRSEWTNDENNSKGVKRKNVFNEDVIPNKKRLLLQRNNGSLRTDINCNDSLPVVPFEDIQEDPAPEINTQTDFMVLLGLMKNEDTKHPRNVPYMSSSSLRISNCTNIPFSSDLGRLITKRDNHSYPEDLQIKKLERLEWYLTNIPSKVAEENYEVTFQEKRHSTDSHYYRHPKRQFTQFAGNVHDIRCLLRFCTPLSVMVVNDDLVELKKEFDKYRIKVNLTRLTVEQLNQHLGKKTRARLTESSTRMLRSSV